MSGFSDVGDHPLDVLEFPMRVRNKMPLRNLFEPKSVNLSTVPG